MTMDLNLLKFVWTIHFLTAPFWWIYPAPIEQIVKIQVIQNISKIMTIIFKVSLEMKSGLNYFKLSCRIHIYF